MDTRIIHAAVFTPTRKHRWGLPLRIIGAPGTAKSALIEQVSEAAGLHVETVIASLRDPTDFLGLPVPHEDGSVGYAPPAWALRAAKAKHAVVFLDEINTAPPAVQAALLRVVLDRVVGDFVLPDTVRILAAQNAVEDAAGGYDLAAPLANRFGTLPDWTGPTCEEWCAHELQAGNGDEIEAATTAEAEEARVMKAWPSERAKAAGIITSFIKRKPSLLHCQPPSCSPEASGAWPSRRTLDMAINALAASKIHGLDESETDRYVGAFIGSAAMRELRSWLVNVDLPDPAELLDGKIEWKHDPDRLDRTMVVCSSCAALVAPHSAEKRIPRAEACWKLIHGLMEVSDVVLPAVRTLVSEQVRLVRGPKGMFKDAEKVLAKFLPVFNAAGIRVGA
jgi:MoxR-like ATPase